MIQMNLLMPTAGKTPESFATLDLMRLPLGILTGMGFIGGGAILRRGKMVQGVTTAATLWIVTVIGLCLGGGQLALGMTTLALALIVLWALKQLESLIREERHATLSVSVNAEGPTDNDIPAMLLRAGFEIRSWDVIASRGACRSPEEGPLRGLVAWTPRQHPDSADRQPDCPDTRRDEVAVESIATAGYAN